MIRSKIEEALPPIVFSTPFSPQYRDIIRIIQKYVPMLHADETMSDILTSPIKYISRRVCTVGNLVSPSVFSREEVEKKSWLSREKILAKCHACTFATVTKTFSSAPMQDRPPYNIASYINCNSKFIVYMISCTQCNLQYVGCTSNAIKICIHRH